MPSTAAAAKGPQTTQFGLETDAQGACTPARYKLRSRVALQVRAFLNAPSTAVPVRTCRTAVREFKPDEC